MQKILCYAGTMGYQTSRGDVDRNLLYTEHFCNEISRDGLQANDQGTVSAIDCPKLCKPLPMAGELPLISEWPMA